MGREIKPFEGIKAYGEPPAPQVQTVDLRRLLVALRRQRRTIILPAVLMGVLGFAYAAAKPETYTSFSSLILDGNVNRSVQQAGGINSAALPAERIENARVVLQSEKLANDVLNLTGLQDDPTFMNPPRSAFTAAIGQAIGAVLSPVAWAKDQVMALVSPAEVAAPTSMAPSGTGTTPVDPARRLAASQLRGGIRVSRVGQSSAMAVSYVSHDPQIAALVANAYAEAYVSDILSNNADSVGQTNAWMRTRLEDLQRQTQTAADAAERFATENQLVELSSGGLLTEQALNQLNSSLTAAVSEAARARAVLNTYDEAVAGGLEGLTEPGSISSSALAIGDNISADLRARLDAYDNVQARLQRLLASSGPDHPQVAGLRQTLNAAAERLFVELQSRRAEAQNAADVAEARVAALRDSVAQASAQNTAQAANLVRLRALQNEAETLSQIYQQTLARSQEIEQQQSFPVSNVRIISSAEVPRSPSGPAVLRTAVAALLLGLFIGMAIAAWREWRERSLRTSVDVTDRSNLRFLGHLPQLPTIRRQRLPAPRAAEPETTPVPVHGNEDMLPVVSKIRPPVVNCAVPVLHYPDSVYAETLRHVRLAADAGARTVPVTAVTSFHPYDGRSSVAFNLAGQLGVGMNAVLLIDADSRARGLSRMLGIDDRPGLTDAAAGRGKWQDMLVSIADTNVLVLPCGSDQGGPSDDLLTGRLLSTIASEANGDFARIIVDVPPLYPVAQGRAILHELPQFLIVGAWGKTPRAMVETALEEDPRLEMRCLGVVYDRVNLRKLKAFLLPGDMENYLTDARSYLSLKHKKFHR